ncbi:hypothetical protein IMZ11_33725 [Microtetraspora sp. AC03309]|uniref:hypothetical protein n=1 Tax=Microtetraspora sp. AC03309 TaxID=2779376 RepID=UPI001E4AC0BD|nr:hypothetical protein [Microtetraspora sp. AC03309]MCC5580589.1 hypothetical protein [Microtetraspora sp. AC03309]
MSVFRCERFPTGDVPIRTAAGIVWFRDGLAVVDDPEMAAALPDLPAVFGITEDDTREQPAKTRRPRRS